jgi:hypothetical protein
LIAADSPASFLDDTPTAKLVRQVLGAISEFDKAMLVAKLKGAGERKRALVGKCKGRKSHAELHPDLVREAKRLRRRSPMGHQRSRRTIAGELMSLSMVFDGIRRISDQASRWFLFCFHRQSCLENRSIPAVSNGFEIRRWNWTRSL